MCAHGRHSHMGAHAAATQEDVAPTADSRSLFSRLSAWALPATTSGEPRQTIFLDKLAVQMAIVFLAYLIAGKLGQAATSIRSGNLGPVWPASGVALAAVLAY